MAVNAVAARRAYGLSTTVATPTPSQNTQTVQTTSSNEGQNSFGGGVGLSQAAAQVVQSAEAAVTALSNRQSPQSAKPAPSILASENGEAPSREEVEGLAKRYLKVINGNAGKPVTDQEVTKVADFYGASAERASRFAGFVSELEAGQQSSDGGKESVAVA